MDRRDCLSRVHGSCPVGRPTVANHCRLGRSALVWRGPRPSCGDTYLQRRSRSTGPPHDNIPILVHLLVWNVRLARSDPYRVGFGRNNRPRLLQLHGLARYQLSQRPAPSLSLSDSDTWCLCFRNSWVLLPLFQLMVASSPIGFDESAWLGRDSGITGIPVGVVDFYGFRLSART